MQREQSYTCSTDSSSAQSSWCNRSPDGGGLKGGSEPRSSVRGLVCVDSASMGDVFECVVVVVVVYICCCARVETDVMKICGHGFQSLLNPDGIYADGLDGQSPGCGQMCV
ncbi:Hypothetical predicted protein [Xyrichtys novacula]|uniref:Uncharacterized protein n=1 Tax=Xyrichtys novacula TaxID=13765 RepID=A0AAV1GTS1_XYRNO|nr:Hypothetical predicted protein [Xyrichtys novacula]